MINVASKHLNTMGVSLEWFGEIAAELGVSRPALYTYVVDREDLLFKCYSSSCDQFEAALRTAEASARSPADILAGFLGETNRPDTPEAAVLSEVDALPPDTRAVIRTRYDALVERLAGTIQLGIAQKQFRPVDPLTVANAVIGMASWASLYQRWTSNAELVLHPPAMTSILFEGLATNRKVMLDSSIDLAPPVQAKIDLFNRQALDEAKREAILLGASILFNRRSIGATRVEDVGAAVGLSKRAIYHHIGNKDALVDACLGRAIKFYLDVMFAAERLQATRLQAYFSAIQTIVNIACDPERSVLVPYVGHGLLSPKGQRAMQAFSRELTEGYRKMFVDGEAEGSIRPLPLDEFLASLPGVFSWVSHSPYVTDANRTTVAEELANLTTKGILA